MKKFILMLALGLTALPLAAQGTAEEVATTTAVKTKVYDESVNPDTQISEALARAAAEGKFVVGQLGGNWCKWCIRFARFVEGDPEIKSLVDDNFVFIHVNYNPRNGQAAADTAGVAEALRRLGNPVRFGYPVLVVLDDKGNVVHTQDSSFLESGDGYDKTKVMRFFKAWTPAAVAKANTGN